MKKRFLLLLGSSMFSSISHAQEGQQHLEKLYQSTPTNLQRNQSQSNVLQSQQQQQSNLSYPMIEEMEAALRQRKPPQNPDERTLWDMFHRGQTAVLRAEITRLKQLYPKWNPPILLTQSKPAKKAANAAYKPRFGLKLTYFLAQDPNDPGVIYANELARYQASTPRTPPERLVQLTESRKDAGVAKLFAWNALKNTQYEQAQYWFNQALAWKPDDMDARYGLALTLFQSGQADTALSQLSKLTMQQAVTLRAEIYFAQGLARYQIADYAAADQLFAHARENGRTGRDLALLQAWLDWRQGKMESALSGFIKLYKEKPDADVAQGLYAAAQATGARDQLLALMGSDINDPLRLVINKQQHDSLRQQGWIWAAQTVPGTREVALAGIEGPWVGLSLLGTRKRSGESGLSQLRISQSPSIEGLFAQDNNVFRWRLTRLDLDSGSLPNNAQFGSYNANSAYLAKPTTQISGWEPTIRWRNENSSIAKQITAGTTMLSAPVSPTPVGEVLIESIGENRNWSTSVYRASVRDSLLSTTGAVDPYSNIAWGRVVRNGVALQYSQTLTSTWRANAAIRAEQLSGEHVANNTHTGFTLGLSYDLKRAGFTYLSVGPGITYDQYQRNLSHFTWGHGGYFSPQQFTNVFVSTQFLTTEGERFIARGQFGMGWQVIKEASSPCFPLAPAIPQPDCAMYGSSNKQGLGLNLEGMFKYAITPHWQIGGAIRLRHSQDYNDSAGLLSVYYTWPPRTHLYRSDLPEWQLSELF